MHPGWICSRVWRQRASFHDRFDRSGSHEGFRLLVPGSEKFINRAREIINAREGIAADALVGKFGEPAFNQVKPDATGGHIVNYEPGMLCKPRAGSGKGPPDRSASRESSDRVKA